jgi:hypothetical protein|tara:strand:- start:345 stop:713 length:369 start_codon:yes stop_codon:yes gene_type:complete
MFSILENRNTFKQLINTKYMTSIVDQVREQGDGVYRVVLNEGLVFKLFEGKIKNTNQIPIFRPVEHQSESSNPQSRTLTGNLITRSHLYESWFLIKTTEGVPSTINYDQVESIEKLAEPYSP